MNHQKLSVNKYCRTKPKTFEGGWKHAKNEPLPHSIKHGRLTEFIDELHCKIFIEKIIRYQFYRNAYWFPCYLKSTNWPVYISAIFYWHDVQRERCASGILKSCVNYIIPDIKREGITKGIYLSSTKGIEAKSFTSATKKHLMELVVCLFLIE